MATIICPECGTENPATAMNCMNCRINLQYALEHRDEMEFARQHPDVLEPTEQQAAVERSSADVPMQESNARPWLIASLVVAAVVLVGMFLAWVEVVDLGGAMATMALVNGWRMGWLPIAVIIGVALCIGLVFVRARSLRLLGVVAMLCCCAASLIFMVSFGAAVVRGDLYGFWVPISRLLDGFLVTLLGIVGMVVFGVVVGVKVILPKK